MCLDFVMKFSCLAAENVFIFFHSFWAGWHCGTYINICICYSSHSMQLNAGYVIATFYFLWKLLKIYTFLYWSFRNKLIFHMFCCFCCCFVGLQYFVFVTKDWPPNVCKYFMKFAGSNDEARYRIPAVRRNLQVCAKERNP